MINRQNYLDIRKFLDYHQKILQNTAGSVEKRRSRLQNSLIWADNTLFSECDKMKKTFPAFLLEQVKQGDITNDYASRLTIDFREFLQWAKDNEPERYGKLKPEFIQSIRIKTYQDSAKTARYYTLEDMRKISQYSPENIRMKRIRAGACFLYLSGMRLSAFLSMPIDCVNLERLQVMQFPELGVYTKFKKRAVTSLYNIPELLEPVREWDNLVRSNSPSNSTWYVRFAYGTRENLNINPLLLNGIDRDEAYAFLQNSKRGFYRNLQELCVLSDVDYKNPHAFRHGHTLYGLQHATTAEQAKAVSLNLMHGSTAITDKIYSQMGGNDINNIITTLGTSAEDRKKPERNNGNGLTAKEILSALSAEEKKKLLMEVLGL